MSDVIDLTLIALGLVYRDGELVWEGQPEEKVEEDPT